MATRSYTVATGKDLTPPPTQPPAPPPLPPWLFVVTGNDVLHLWAPSLWSTKLFLRVPTGFGNCGILLIYVFCFELKKKKEKKNSGTIIQFLPCLILELIIFILRIKIPVYYNLDHIFAALDLIQIGLIITKNKPNLTSRQACLT